MPDMQFIIKIVFVPLLLCAGIVSAQSTYLPLDSKHQQLLERIGIKLQSNSFLNVSTVKPLSRKMIAETAELADSLSSVNAVTFSDIDLYNARSLLMNNS